MKYLFMCLALVCVTNLCAQEGATGPSGPGYPPEQPKGANGPAQPR